MTAMGHAIGHATRRVFAVLLLAALVSGGRQATRPSMTQKEALDLFFSSVDARQRFAAAVKAVGASLDRGLGQRDLRHGQGVLKVPDVGVLTPPWARPGSPVMASMQRAVDDNLHQLIETLRRLIETTAEPLKIENVSLDASTPMVESRGYVRNASISQLSTFNVADLKLDIFAVSASIKVDFDKLDAHGIYNVDATASGQLHVFGDGDFNVRLYQPAVEVDVQLGYDKEHFSVEKLKIYVKLKKLKVIMSNFLGGGEVGELVCGIVSDVGPAFLEEYHDEVTNMLSTEVKSTANALLAKLDINTIIDIITGRSND